MAAPAAVALLAAASAAAATDWFQVFRAEKVAPITVLPADLVDLPDLSPYGDVRITKRPLVREVTGAQAAELVTALDPLGRADVRDLVLAQLLIVYATVGYWPPSPFTGLLFLAAQAIALLTLGLLLSTDGLWHGAMYALQDATVPAQFGPRFSAPPFLSQTGLTTVYVLWTVLWTLLILGLAAIAFHRRDL